MSVEIISNVTERQIKLLEAMRWLESKDLNAAASLTDLVDPDIRALATDGLCSSWKNGFRQCGYSITDLGRRLLSQIEAKRATEATPRPTPHG